MAVVLPTRSRSPRALRSISCSSSVCPMASRPTIWSGSTVNRWQPTKSCKKGTESASRRPRSKGPDRGQLKVCSMRGAGNPADAPHLVTGPREGEHMQDDTKGTLRAANRISSHVQRLLAAPGMVELPERDWIHCQDLIRQIDRCRTRGWNLAAAVLNDRLDHAIEYCLERLQQISRQLSAAGRLLPAQTAREIFCDLVALSDEFEGVTIDV